MTSIITDYLEHSGKQLGDLPVSFVAYLANLDLISSASPVVAKGIIQELVSQRSNLKLIASENFSSISTQVAMGNLFTDKYAEGFPHSRFYAGCENVDLIEETACNLAKNLFGAEHAYVQPHSGADANLVAFWAILSARVEQPALDKLGIKDSSELSPGDWNTLRQTLGNQKLMGMDLMAGGHLTHGFRKNVSSRMFNVSSYGVHPETGLIDYDALERQAREVRPLILLAGYSAYPRRIDFQRMRKIADSVGAVFMVDMAHFAGLVAGKVFTGPNDPIAYADVVTTTTHKTLRGPRGGMVLCRKEFASYVDKGCPLVLGGPLPHVMAAKAVALEEASRQAFAQYAAQIAANAQALASKLISSGQRVLSGGTDNHLVLIDVGPLKLTGRQAEQAAREARITLNRNTIPADPNGPWYTSGLRLGTPALTTLGMKAPEMEEVAAILSLVLSNTSADNGKVKYSIKEKALAEAHQRVARLLSQFILYPEIDVPFLQKRF